MSRAKDLAKLGGLARLVLDHRLALLREAADRRDQSRQQIAALDQGAEPTDLPPLAAGQVGILYQSWADARRSELNMLLARQTADWLEARQNAQTAFGRAEALRGAVGRLADRK
jgi:hypothetical protein